MRRFAPHPVALAASLLAATLAAPAWAQSSAAPATVIEVTGIRASLLQSIATKRDSESNIEVVSAEDVGKLPDKNIADALSRIPGVNVQYGGALAMDEAERVAIRGTSPNLNLVTVFGHALSSGDWHVGDQGSSGRSVGFGLMPSQLIGRSIVYKTGRADITEGGIAGTVDIELRKPLDFRNALTGDIAIGAVHATLPNKTDPQLAGLISWKNASNTFGVLAQVYKERRHLRRDGQETFSFANIAANSAAAIANPSLAGLRLPGSLNSALFEGVRDRTGGYLGLQLKPTRDTELNFSAFHSVLKADNYNSSAFALPGTLINQGANGYLVQNPVIQGDVLVSATLVRNPASPATFRVVGMQFDHNQREGAESLSSFYDLEGKLKLSNALSFKARVGYTEGSGVTNKQPSLTFGLLNPNMRYTINTTRPTDYAMLDAAGNPINLATTSSFSQLSNTGAQVASSDDETYLHLDGAWQPAAGLFSNIKFGLRSSKHNRSYDVIAPRWNAQDLPSGLPVTPSPFISVTGGLLVTNIVPTASIPVPATAYPANYASGIDANFPRQLFRFDPSQLSAFGQQYINWDPVGGKTWTSGYTVEEKNNAAYLMGEFSEDALSGNVGVRLVRTEVYSLSYQALPNGTAAGQCVPTLPCSVPGAIVGSRFATYLPQVVQTSHDAVLPSLNLRYRLTRDQIFRFAVNKTLGRPNYNELAGAVSLNNTLLTGSSGNPNLKPIISTNLDLAYEWYIDRNTVFTASYFTMDMKDYVKAGTSQVEFFNTSTGTNSIYTVTSRIGVKARIRGAEASFQMPLGGGFGFVTNATYVDSRDQDGVTLLGTSRWTANVQAYYENNKLGVRLAWNQRTDYPIGFVGNGTNTPNNGVHYYEGSGTLSAALNYKITDSVRLSLDLNNLNNPVRHTYFITPNAPGYWHQSGRQYFLTLRARI
jgi:iron complex outermembrane recepter protein